MSDVQIQVLAKATVLGCPIDAGFIKSGKDSIVVVYGKTDPTAKAKSLAELVGELSKMVTFFESPDDAKTSLTDKLPKSLADILDKIQFQLKEVFFVKSISENPDAGKPPTENKTSEFAFWFDILTNELTEGWPISVERVSIKLWRTSNPRILDEMNISSMQELLAFSQTVPKAKA